MMQQLDPFDILVTLLEEMNGPIEVGISASFDTGKDPVSAIPLGTDSAKRALWAIGMCDNYGVTNLRLIAATVAAAEFIKAKVAYDDHSNITQVDDTFVPLALKHPDLVQKVKAEMGARAVADGILLIVATKVTFWQTNHHVGQGRMQGYFRKIALKEFADVPEDLMLKVGWAIGHWASTKFVLSALNVPDITGTPLLKLKPARDISLRLSSVPAGCAKLAFAMAAFVKLKASIFARFVPIPVGMADLISNYEAILNHPASYHIGHSFLTDKKQAVVSDVSEDIMECLSAFVHAIIPGSTLAKSRAAIPEDAIRGHNWFVALQNAKRRIQESNFIDDAQIKTALVEFTQGNRDMVTYESLSHRIEVIRELAIHRLEKDVIVMTNNPQPRYATGQAPRFPGYGSSGKSDLSGKELGALFETARGKEAKTDLKPKKDESESPRGHL